MSSLPGRLRACQGIAWNRCIECYLALRRTIVDLVVANVRVYVRSEKHTEAFRRKAEESSLAITSLTDEVTVLKHERNSLLALVQLTSSGPSTVSAHQALSASASGAVAVGSGGNTHARGMERVAGRRSSGSSVPLLTSSTTTPWLPVAPASRDPPRREVPLTSSTEVS